MTIATIAGKTILDGNFYISDGTTVVEIFSSKIDYNYDDALTEIPIAVSFGERSEGEDYTRIVDLKRIKEGLAVQGVLEDETSETAKVKMNNLIEILAKKGGELTCVFGTGLDQTLWQKETDPKVGTGVFVKKIMVTQTAGIYGDTSLFNRKLDVTIQLVRGKDM